MPKSVSLLCLHTYEYMYARTRKSLFFAYAGGCFFSNEIECRNNVRFTRGNARLYRIYTFARLVWTVRQIKRNNEVYLSSE